MTRALVALLLVAAAIAVCIGHGVATRPVMADNQLYFFLTERTASGVPPHVSMLDIKTHLSTLIGAAAMVVGRYFGVADVMSGRAASVAAAAVATVLAWLLGFELVASRTREPGREWIAPLAGLVAAAATLAIHGLYYEAATGFQPKVFMVAFLLAAHLACARRKPWLTGVAGMCSILCWQPSGVVAAGCALAAFLDRRATWASIARTAVAATLVLVAYEAWFAWEGALGAQVHQEFALAFGAQAKPFDWKESTWFVMTEAQPYQSTAHPLPAAFTVVTALMLVGAAARPRRTLEFLREEPGLVSFWTAALLGMAFTLHDHQAHPDMLLVQPYFAVSCGIGFGWLASLLARVPAGRAIGALATLAFVAWELQTARIDTRRWVAGPDSLDRQLAQARLLDLYRDHRGSVWVMGSVHLLAFEHMDNWTPVGFPGRETADLDMKDYRPLRDGKMPEIIVSGRGLRPGGTTWLPVEYVDITPQVLADDRIRVYSRRLGPGSGFDRGSAPVPRKGPEANRKPPPRKPPSGRQAP